MPRQTFGISFWHWLLVLEPKTSFPECWRKLGDSETMVPFLASTCCLLIAEKEANGTDCIEDFPSRRLDEPENGLNFAIFRGGSSSTDKINTVLNKMKVESQKPNLILFLDKRKGRGTFSWFLGGQSWWWCWFFRLLIVKRCGKINLTVSFNYAYCIGWFCLNYINVILLIVVRNHDSVTSG